MGRVVSEEVGYGGVRGMIELCREICDKIKVMCIELCKGRYVQELHK